MRKLYVSECICELCNLHKTYEKHFLMICLMYFDYRIELFLQVEHPYPSFSEKNEESIFHIVVQNSNRHLADFF